MTRQDALAYVAYYVDDALNERQAADMPANRVRLVGWQCGFEPMFVAVWSHIPGVVLDDSDAEEIAADLLAEKQWFSGEPTAADYII